MDTAVKVIQWIIHKMLTVDVLDTKMPMALKTKQNCFISVYTTTEECTVIYYNYKWCTESKGVCDGGPDGDNDPVRLTLTSQQMHVL